MIDPVQAIVNVEDYQFAVASGGADLAAVDHRQERSGRSAVQSGTLNRDSS